MNMSKITFHTPIGQVCDPENLRYAIDKVLVTGEGHAIASNGAMIAVVPVETDLDRPVLVPAEAAALYRYQLGQQVDVNCREIRYHDSKGRTLVGELGMGKFPAIKTVMPVADPEDYHHVCLNTDYLAKLANAVGSREDYRGVVDLLVPKDNERPILVIAGKNCSHRGIGVLMPCSVNEDAREYYEATRQALDYTSQAVERLRQEALEAEQAAQANEADAEPAAA